MSGSHHQLLRKAGLALSQASGLLAPGLDFTLILTVSHSRLRPDTIGNSRVSCLPGLASVEAYSYKTNEWFFVAPMNTRRSSVGVGVVEGKWQPWVVATPCPSTWAFFLHPVACLIFPLSCPSLHGTALSARVLVE